MKLKLSNLSAFGFAVIVSLFFATENISAQTVYTQPVSVRSCPLNIGGAYKTANSSGVWVITEGCEKRPIKDPAVFFSHFSSWDEVVVTSNANLNNVPNHTLSFLPWGRLRKFDNGSLLKTVDDPKVYLMLGGRIHEFDTLSAFLSFGFKGNQIEDVVSEVLNSYTRSTGIAGVESAPEGFVFKYPNSAQVYRVEKRASDGKLVKRHIRTLDEFEKIYRTTRLPSLPLKAVFEDLKDTDTSLTLDINPSTISRPTPVIAPVTPVTPPPVAQPITEARPIPPQVPLPPPPLPTPPVTLVPPTISIPPSTGTNLVGGISSKTQVVSERSLTNPGLNVSVNEPGFGTKIRRITNKVTTGGWGTQIYSQLQSFSKSLTYVLLYEDGDTIVRRMNDLSLMNISNLGEFNVPRWYSDRELFVFDNNADEVLRAQIGDVSNNTLRTVFTFPTKYQRINGNRSFDELSHDSRWVAGMASSGNDDLIFALNITDRRIGAELSLANLYRTACRPDPQYGTVPPDWIGMSPSGRYLMVQWAADGTDRCNGLESFNADTGAFVGRVYDGHQHGDIGMTPEGVEYFMTFELRGPDGSTRIGDPHISVRMLPGSATGASAPKYLTALGWDQSGGHISCQGRGEFCAISTYGNPTQPFGSEIFLQYIDGRVLRVAHTRSTSCGYWVQPRPSLAPNNKYVIFASDWGVDRCSSNEGLGRGEAYLVELPSNVGAGPLTSASPAPVPPIPATTPPTPTAPTPAPAPVPPAPAPTPVTYSQMPASTHILGGQEYVDFYQGDGAYNAIFAHGIGQGTCLGTDWVKYDWYLSQAGSTSFTKIGSSVDSGVANFTGGHIFETQGCAKGSFLMIFNVPTGTHRAGVCITHNTDATKRYCQTVEFVK